MCGICANLARLADSIPSSAAMQSLSLALDEIQRAHGFTLHKRTPKRSIPDAVRHIQSAVLGFAAYHSQSNYAVITASIASYWSARQRASDARRAQILNPEGHAEPRPEPRAFYAPSDSCIFGQKLESPQSANLKIEHAKNLIARNVAKADQLLQRNYVLPTSEAKIKQTCARIVDHANSTECALAEFVSAQRHNPIRRSVADDVTGFLSCYH